jgi:hypothetical protein
MFALQERLKYHASKAAVYTVVPVDQNQSDSSLGRLWISTRSMVGLEANRYLGGRFSLGEARRIIEV